MTHGYYLAANRTRHGDPDFARLARILWRIRGHRHPSRVDGVSMWLDIRDGRSMYNARIVCRDLFAEEIKPLVRDL